MWAVKAALLKMESLMSNSEKIDLKEGDKGRVLLHDLLENKITTYFPNYDSSLPYRHTRQHKDRWG